MINSLSAVHVEYNNPDTEPKVAQTVEEAGIDI